MKMNKERRMQIKNNKIKKRQKNKESETAKPICQRWVQKTCDWRQSRLKLEHTKTATTNISFAITSK